MVVDGKYQQLNPNILQIENEFYGVVRPKQVARSGESPSKALMDRGVEYVEIRSLDLNPFVPIGIDAECIRFFDLFLVYCLFVNDSELTEAKRCEATENRNKVIMQGRDPNLTLSFDGEKIPFTAAAVDLLDAMQELAALLDEVNGGSCYGDSLAAQKEKIADSSLTPSSRILSLMETGYDSFYHFAMDMAGRHKAYFVEEEISDQTLQNYRQEATASIARQQEVEAADIEDFPAFLKDYFEQQNA